MIPRLVPVMSTDGQGVTLAFPFSSDAQQRPAIDVLARRVGHRLGCPIAVCGIQRGRPLLDGALERLTTRGASNIVLAPLTFSLPVQSVAQPEIAAVAAPLGGGPAVVAAVLESLACAERLPDPEMHVVIVAPASEAAVIPALRDECAQEDGHGWGSLSVVVMASERAPAVAAVQAMRERLGRVLLVPLSVAPGPYVAHVSSVAQAGGVDHTTQTLHATEALTKLLLCRVCSARRPPS